MRPVPMVGWSKRMAAPKLIAAGRLPGLEALGRYAAFLARVGRKPEAEENLAEIDRRLARANPQFRRDGRRWRDLAAQALAQA